MVDLRLGLCNEPTDIMDTPMGQFFFKTKRCHFCNFQYIEEDEIEEGKRCVSCIRIESLEIDFGGVKLKK